MIYLLFMGLGALMMFLPLPLWYVLSLFRRKKSHPSDTFLVASRLAGIVMIVSGVILYAFQYA